MLVVDHTGWRLETGVFVERCVARRLRAFFDVKKQYVEWRVAYGIRGAGCSRRDILRYGLTCEGVSMWQGERSRFWLVELSSVVACVLVSSEVARLRRPDAGVPTSLGFTFCFRFFAFSDFDQFEQTRFRRVCGLVVEGEREEERERSARSSAGSEDIRDVTCRES